MKAREVQVQKPWSCCDFGVPDLCSNHSLLQIGLGELGGRS